MNRYNAEKKKSQYKRDSHFHEVCRWLCDLEPLSENMKTLYRETFKGEPYQRFLYNTIIWNMPDDTYETVIDTAAELYHYQRALNKKIGRTYYSESVKDATLIRHIYREIIYRINRIKKYEYGESFEDRVMEVYLEKYAKTTPVAKSTQELLQASIEYFNQNTDMSASELIRFMGQITPCVEKTDKEVPYWDYFNQCLRRNEAKNNPKNSNICKPFHYTKYLELHSGNWSEGKLPKEKDELYIICIGLAFTFEDFQILRTALAREHKDSTRFADNTFSYRDEKIQSVLRNIDNWYEETRIKYGYPQMELVPQKVLLEVDKMLEENGYQKLYEGKRYKKKKNQPNT